MSTAIITDSGAALPPNTKATQKIKVVPIAFMVDGTQVREGEVPTEELARKFRQNKASTSAPSPGEFAKAIQESLNRDGISNVLILTISKELSASHKSASLAAEQFGKNVGVLDTRTAAAGQALVAMSAVEAAGKNLGLDEILLKADDTADKVRFIGALEGVEGLVRSGRIPKAAGWAGAKLSIHPIFEIRQGKIKRHRPVRSDKKALQRILDVYKSSEPKKSAVPHLAFAHAQAPEKTRELINLIGAEKDSYFVSEFGQALSLVSGVGTIGLAWYWRN